MTAADRDLALIARWRDARDNAARAELVRAYTPMIDRAAERYGAADVDDLAAEGAIAFLRAVDDFDATRGVAFGAFASRRVAGAVRSRAVPRVRETVEVDPELASGVQDSPEDFAAASEARRLTRADLIEALGALTDREADVISRRYLGAEDVTFAAVGAALGISRERVRQIERDALAKLRRLMTRHEAA